MEVQNRICLDTTKLWWSDKQWDEYVIYVIFFVI